MNTKDIIRKIRGEMSHVEMAAKYKLTVATIYRWEKGERLPDRPSLVKLALSADSELYLSLLGELGLLPAGSA